jgi:hypothetical protein
MSTRTKALLSGVAALIIAISAVGAAALLGFQYGGLSQSSKQGAPGTLTVMLTDPPHVPPGVTAIYVWYSDVSVHISEAGQQSGWRTVAQKGEINLMATLNVSQTIAAAKVPNGDYNALRFNITSATVTFNGKNYTAFVPHSELFIPIARGGIEVNDSKPSAVLIDMSPMVINIGSLSNPEFIIRPSAVALPVPSSQVTEEMEHVGFRMDLIGKSWWSKISEGATANLRITAASLTGTSLAVSVKNTGANTTIRLVVVSPLAQTLKGGVRDHLPTALFGSAVFFVEKNGTLVPLMQLLRTGSENHDIDDILALLGSSGYSLPAGGTATFSFTGQVILGLGKQGQGIVAGQQYLVTVLGTDALASTVVVAS